MSHIKSNKKYVDIKKQTIYVLISPIEKEFFVGQVVPQAERNRYKNHFTLRYKQTDKMVSKIKNEDKKPKMYRLEDLETTEVKAYYHCLAWINFFTNHGYKSVAYPGTNGYAADPGEDVLKIFDAIKDKKIDEVLSDKADMFPHYKERKDKKKDDGMVTISFRVTQEEADKLRDRAKKQKITTTQFCRNTALDGCIVNVNFNFLSVYLAEMKGLKSLVRQTMITIYKLGNYYPPDLNNIQKTVEILEKHEDQITKKLIETMKTMRKEIRAAREK